MECDKCGSELEKNAKFCTNCGNESSKSSNEKTKMNSSTSTKFLKIVSAVVLIMLILMVAATVGTLLEQSMKNPFAKLIILIIGIGLSRLTWKGIVK